MHRVLAPGGRVLVSVPTPTPFFDVLNDALTRHVPAGAAFLRMVFSLDDTAEIREHFQSAGFRDVIVRPAAKVLRVASPREFLWQYVHSTPLASLIDEADDALIAALERDVVTRWQPWVRDGGMTYEQSVIVTTAGR